MITKFKVYENKFYPGGTNGPLIGDYIILKSDKDIPPIVITDKYRIIDGNHRVNGLKMIGEEYIKAFIGINI